MDAVSNSKFVPYVPVYPNSENIDAHLRKERLRVVEAATRAEIKINSRKEVIARAEEIQTLRDQAAVRYHGDGTVNPSPIPQGQLIDLEV